MRVAAALSEHPVTAAAVGEVTGAVLEALGGNPDVALLCVTPPHAGALEDAATAVRALLEPAALVGCAASAVIGPAREVEDTGGIVLWAARTGGATAAHLPEPALGVLDPPFVPAAMLVAADPFSFALPRLLEAVDARWPGIPVVGGYASAARGPGGNRLVADGLVATGGAVVSLVGPGVAVTTLASQGTRPAGDPLVVTAADGGAVLSLAGRPAYDWLTDVRSGLDPDHPAEIVLARLVDERIADPRPRDFVPLAITGRDLARAAIVVAEPLPVGATVQFQIRDAASAESDLRRVLGAPDADGALVVTAGRGRALAAVRDHDASIVSDAVDGAPLAGFAAAGAVARIAGRHVVASGAATVALVNGQD